MPNVTAGYGRFYDLVTFFWEISYFNTLLKRYNFIKLLQIVKDCDVFHGQTYTQISVFSQYCYNYVIASKQK